MKKHRKKPNTQKEMLLTAVRFLTVRIKNCYLMICAGVLLIGNSRVPFYATEQDEDGEETGEDVTYEYKAIHRYANEDDCAGTIQFDFHRRTARVLTLADGDICNTNIFARTVIRHIWGLDAQELPKSAAIHIRL